MKSYWIWFFLQSFTWFFALSLYINSTENMLWRLAGVTVYFSLFFIMPLLRQRRLALMIVLIINSFITILVLFPNDSTGFNMYVLLILSLLMAEACYRLPTRLASVIAGIHIASILLILSQTNDLPIPVHFIGSFFILFYSGFFLYTFTKASNDDLYARYDALLSEYRKVKRRLASEDELARQEERVLIGHEIHDSVGHKLTALLMQLEAYRLQASKQDQAQVASLKKLASDSLNETRNAVKALKRTDIGALPGVLRLIRKLESESFIRIHFSIKHGAFAAALTGEQSFVIYRSVQEALTNIMKHSDAREADIVFEAPGGSVFRFEIINPVKDERNFTEGFGLSNMRTRLEKIGGQLEVVKTNETFMVRGTVKLMNE